MRLTNSEKIFYQKLSNVKHQSKFKGQYAELLQIEQGHAEHVKSFDLRKKDGIHIA